MIRLLALMLVLTACATTSSLPKHWYKVRCEVGDLSWITHEELEMKGVHCDNGATFEIETKEDYIRKLNEIYTK